MLVRGLTFLMFYVFDSARPGATHDASRPCRAANDACYIFPVAVESS
jgi:hypothetical protein